VNEWLTLQPDLQYIVNRGLDPALRDAPCWACASN
jgi:carbohydrate-selective porin OprB